MTVLQKIRNKPKLLIGIIALGLLAFVIPWSEVMNLINSRKMRAFEVNGENVSTNDYFTRVTEFENFQKAVSGQNSLDENATSQIREYVYDEMVKEIILQEQADKLGLGVSEEELHDLVFGNNISPILRQIPFFLDPQTRQFSPQSVIQFVSFANTELSTVKPEQYAQLEEIKSIWATIQNMIKYQRLEEKYNTLLANSILVNDIEVKSAQNALKSTANIAYVVDRYSSIADSTVTVTDAEIDKLYKDRKNNFKVSDNLRKVSYFTKQIFPSESDFAAVEKEINTANEKLAVASNPALVVADYSEVPYQDIYFSEKNLSPEEANFAKTATIGDTYGPLRSNDSYRLYKLVDRTAAPDSINLSIIVIPEGADKLAANNKADSIISVINGGKDFSVVAKEVMPQSNGDDGNWVTEPQLLSAGISKDFVSTCFTTSTGNIAKMNEQGAIQIVKVNQKSQPVSKYKLALIQIPVVVSDQTLTTLDNELNQFVAENNDPKTFEKAAKDKGYNIISGSIISGSQPNISQISGSRQVINWAFNEKVGSIKKFDLSEYKIIALIDSKIDKGYMPVSEVKEVLKTELIKDKKAEKMIADLKAKNITSLEGYAQAIGSKVDTVNFVNFDTPNIMGIGHESILNVYSEIGEANKLVGPVKGDNGVFALDVLNKVDQSQSFNVTTFKQTANSQNYYRVMSQSMIALKDKMKVSDNRVSFF